MGVVTSRLPKYAGRHDVGSYDIEVVLDRPRTFGTAYLTENEVIQDIISAKTTLKDGGKLRPALTMESVLFTLFYPCESPKELSWSVVRPHWIERPVSRTARGWLKFANARANVPQKRLYTYFLLAFACLFGSRIAIPAVQSGRLKTEKKSKLPVVIFSHGLAGNRKVYSQYCGELASHGFVVAAIEHRDGTAPSTTIIGRNGEERSIREYTPAALFLWKDSTRLSQNQVRAQQLLMRVAEVETTLETLGYMSSGGAINNVRSALQPAFDSRAWQGILDVKQDVIMAGHSFGSATAISCLRMPGIQRVFSKGICLDPWVDPLGEGLLEADPCAQWDEESRSASPALNGSGSESKPGIQVALLVQNSEPFSNWHDHFAKVFQLVQDVRASSPSYLITIGGTVHSSFSDFHLLLPSWLTHWQNRKASTNTRKDSKRDMDIIVAASLEFLDHLPLDILKQQVSEHDNSIPAGDVVINCRTEQV